MSEKSKDKAVRHKAEKTPRVGDKPTADAKLANKVADRKPEPKPDRAKPTRPAVQRSAPRTQPAGPTAGLMSASHMQALAAGVQVKP